MTGSFRKGAFKVSGYKRGCEFLGSFEAVRVLAKSRCVRCRLLPALPVAFPAQSHVSDPTEGLGAVGSSLLERME